LISQIDGTSQEDCNLSIFEAEKRTRAGVIVTTDQDVTALDTPDDFS